MRRIPWDDLQSERSYSAIRAYNLSKLANVLFVRALAERLDRQTVVANAVSPGFVRTELNRGATLPFRIFFTLVRPLQHDPETGAETPVWAATSPEAAALTGNYFEKLRPAKTNPLTSDRAAAERMWAASAELCGPNAIDPAEPIRAPPAEISALKVSSPSPQAPPAPPGPLLIAGW